MTDELRNLIVDIKRKIILGETVKWNGYDYTPHTLIWGVIKGEEVYSVELIDTKARNSTVEVRIQDLRLDVLSL